MITVFILSFPYTRNSVGTIVVGGCSRLNRRGRVLHAFKSSGVAFLGLRRDGNHLVPHAGACDSAVGGILPQSRGESRVFPETEGEFRRERDSGCSSENRVSIFWLYFQRLKRQSATRVWLFLHVFQGAQTNVCSSDFIFRVCTDQRGPAHPR